MAMEPPIADARARSAGAPTLAPRRLGALVGPACRDAWRDPPGKGFSPGIEGSSPGRFCSLNIRRATRRDARPAVAGRTPPAIAFAAWDDPGALTREKAV